MKYYFVNLDPKTFDIDGGMVGTTEGLVTINRPDRYQLRNEVSFSNVWEFYKRGDD